MNESKQEFITIQKATKIYGFSSQILRKWEKAGLIKSQRTPRNTRMYRRCDLESALGITESQELDQTRNIIYCRVSSKKQSDDLKRQSEYLRSIYPEYDLVEDVGSGIDFSRKGLQAILEYAMQGILGEVVVAHRDRLSRFGFELLEVIISKGGGKITVLENESGKSGEEELAEDLLAIIHVFNCRQMGKRRYGNKKSQDQDLSNSSAEENTS